jgi:YVTN family beta-propeller protein
VNTGYNNLQIIDPQTYQTVGAVEFGSYHNPYYSCGLTDGRVAVSHYLDNSVSLVNIHTLQEEASIPVGLKPEGLVQVGDQLFVTITNMHGDRETGKVYVIDLTADTVSNQFNVGDNPQWIGIGQDGNLHVVCTGDYYESWGEVFVVDPYTHQILNTVYLGSSPGSWAMLPSGVAYLGAYIWGSGGHLLAYDTNTYQVIHDENNPLELGGGVMGVTAGEDNRLYICMTENDQIKVMDQNENIIATYNVGDAPQSIALHPVESSTPEGRWIEPPAEFLLMQNYPNPFNAATVIPYQLHNGSTSAVIHVINIMGQQVRQFSVRGNGSIIWDGTDQRGNPLSAGTYWVQLSGSGPSQTIRMVYLP